MKGSVRRAGFRVAIAGSICAGLTASVFWCAAHAAGAVPDPWAWAGLFAATLAGAISAGLVVRWSFGRRLTHLARSLDAWRADDSLQRLPAFGDDEVGRIASAFNRALARITALQTDVIDGRRELEDVQRALALSEALTRKQRELEQRLRERALLFEVLRESASSHDLDRVLAVLAERVASAMRLRQLAVILRADEQTWDPEVTTTERRATRRWIVRATWGFENGHELIGARVSRPAAAWLAGRSMLLVPDVARAPHTVAFWSKLPRDGSFAAVPIVHGDEEIGLLAVTRAADDPLEEIDGRYLQAVADQAAMAIHNAQLVAQLERLSTQDELTGLPNRRLFVRRFERAHARAERYGHALSLLVLDVDHFKQLNDRCGHPTGDAALRAIARLLLDSLREVDTVARVGGEEFWVLLAHTDEVGASEVAEKLRRRVAMLDVEGAPGQPLGHLSVSIGVSSLRRGESAEALLARADAALYRAKGAGRDRVAIVA